MKWKIFYQIAFDKKELTPICIARINIIILHDKKNVKTEIIDSEINSQLINYHNPFYGHYNLIKINDMKLLLHNNAFAWRLL